MGSIPTLGINLTEYNMSVYDNLEPEVVRYTSNGRKGIVLIDSSNEVYCHATVNLPDVPLPENHVLVKDYNENAGILSYLVSNGIVRDTGVEHKTGFIEVNQCELLI